MTSPPQSPPKKSSKKTPEEKERLLRSVYFDILKGYSDATIDNSKVRIIHFDVQTQTKIDQHYSEVFNKARSKGLLTHSELLDKLKEDGLWTKEEEEDLERRKKNIEGLRSTSTKALNEQMRQTIEDQLDQAKQELLEIENKKNKLITNTCEQFAERRSSDMIVRLSFYNEDGAKPFFSKDDFDLLEREDISKLVQIYNKATRNLDGDNIRQISISEFFTSYYSLIESYPHAFFNKPIHELTFFQVNLLNYAKLFSSILKNLDPPEHIKNDAEKLLTFAKNERKKIESEKRKRKREENKPQTLG